MKTKNILAALLVSASFSSCELDYVPTDSISDSSITEENYQHLLTGVYDAAQSLGTYLFNSDTSGDNLNSTWVPELDQNSYTTSNSTIKGYWNTLYQGVQLSNNLINLLEGNSGDNLSPDNEKIVAQARFLRAYFYSIIAENWGDAPLLTEVTDAQVARSPEADIWRFIIEDLKYAVAKAPDFTDPGFVSNVSSKAFLSRVYLLAPEGVRDLSLAYRYAEEVIANPNFALADDYADIWHSKTSREFVQQWTNLGNDVGASGWFLRSALVSRYEARYGAGSAGYGEFGRYEYPVDQSLIRAFEPGDNRYAASIRHLVLDDEETWDCVKYPSYNSADNWPVIRIAELYLISAEAQGYPAGVARLNELRQKRGLPALVEETDITADTFLSRIMQERRVELAFEGHRFYDLRRWYNSSEQGKTEVLALRVYQPGEVAGSRNQASDAFNIDDEGTRLLYPVPESAIDQNPALLPNNPGY